MSPRDRSVKVLTSDWERWLEVGSNDFDLLPLLFLFFITFKLLCKVKESLILKALSWKDQIVRKEQKQSLSETNSGDSHI
jgi:hypothetical protein